MGFATRLRQVALVAAALGPVADRLRQELDLGPPYHDPGIIGFGLENAVFAVGDTFIEVVAPVRPDTTAGRYLERQGGDGGYMAIFQVPDMAAARRRVDELGIRVVYRADHADIAGTHLHPKDVPGAIVSLDWADPAGTWRWAGPDWTGQVPDHPAGGITALTVRARHPTALGQRWAEVLATDSRPDGPDTIIVLDDGRQALRFAGCGPGEPEGISGVEVAIPTQAGARRRSVEIGGVALSTTPTENSSAEKEST